MRLESVSFHNYRQYKDVSINFPETEEDVQIIVGKNGVGKTTFLNAINWCLYGDEPHSYSYRDRQTSLPQDISLPIKNLKAGKEEDVFVELKVSTFDKEKYTFRRTLDNKDIDNFSVIITDKRGESTHFVDKAADEYVDNFVPQAIREFFFFDGEQLDNYFLDEKTRNVERRISILSHIDILERMESNLQNRYNSIKRKAGSLNTDIGLINSKLEKENDKFISEKARINSIEEDIKRAKNQIKKLDVILDGIPDIEALEGEYKSLSSKLKGLEDEMTENEEDRRDLLLSSSYNLFLKDAFEYVLKDIEEKRQNNELPKDIDQKVIETSLSKKVCEVCGRDLDEESITYLNGQLADYTLSSEQSKMLQKLETPLNVQLNIVKKYPKDKNLLNKSYVRIKKDINETAEQFKKVSKRYAEYDDEKIRQNYLKREALKQNVEDEESNLIEAKANLRIIQNKIDELNEELSRAMEADKKTKELNKKKELVSESMDLVHVTMNQIMDDTKIDIENFTRKVFFDLIWKKETYSDILIDESYNLNLIHNVTQSNAIGSASAAERELLVLAFTLGVHSISGFSSPLLIDTPLARVSDEHRVNFAKVLLEVSKVKQIILLLTEAEFSDDIKEFLNSERISKYEINMGDDESNSIIEELK